MPRSKTVNSKGSVLITGAAKRIGRAIALYLSGLNYSIALHYNHSRKEAQALAHKIQKSGGRCEIFGADFAHKKAADHLLAQVTQKFHDLQFLVNNASIFEKSDLKSDGLKNFDRQLAINFTAPFILTRHFAQNIKKGSIINILDTHVNKNRTVYLSYLLAKKSLADLTRLAAVELAPHIRVNAVAPGLILPPEHKNGDYLDRLAKNIPLKRNGEPVEIAKAVHFLMENTYITGQILFVDGGEHLI